MARPTMSKTIYMQQLGRGMRLCEGKDFLMVFDFVDNANLFNQPYSLHRLVGQNTYSPGGLVLGTKKAMKWDKDMFQKGEKPDVLVDYPIHATDYEVVDLFNWRESAKGMISQLKLTRYLAVSYETVLQCLKDGKITPDMEVPISDNRSIKYFKKQRVQEYSEQFGWQMITPENIKQSFLDMVTKKLTMSYKPVFMLAFLDCMDENGKAELSDVTAEFSDYYENRRKNGLTVEKKACLFTSANFTEKDVRRLILAQPFKRLEDMGFMSHSKNLGTIQLAPNIVENLTEEDIEVLKEDCKKALETYFS